jgi:aminocarboxymuconate-semialdehyde decarboxylase
MIERLILSGLFEKYSNLRLCLAHGGGFLPYNIWRLDHAYHLRNDLRQSLPKRPSEYLSHFYFDSLVHSGAALQFLIDVVGAGRVVIGTDYPMGMGDMEAVARIRALSGVSPREREQILRQNALRALGMDRSR